MILYIKYNDNYKEIEWVKKLSAQDVKMFFL